MFNQHNHNGFTLIETLFAVLIFSASLVSLMAIAGRGITAATSAREQTVAHYLAQEGIEVVRNIRDTNFMNLTWDDTFKTCTETDPCQISYSTNDSPPTLIECDEPAGCVIEESFGAFVNSGTTQSPYSRKIYVNQGSVDLLTGNVSEYQVVSKISWKSKGVDRLVTMQTVLKKWQ